MPDEKKLDPFKPTQPAIPGVSPVDRKDSSPEPHSFPSVGVPNIPSRVFSWLALVVVCAFIMSLGIFYWTRNCLPKSATRIAEAAPIPAAETPVEPPRAAEKLPLGPGPIATTAELAGAWSSKRFLFRDPVTNEPVPAMVVRLPQSQLWGFSLREPFGTCPLEYVTDPQRLQSEYQLHADHPMVVDPCNHTVYDLLRYGAGPSSDSLVRGEMVEGPGIRPPIAIEVRTEGKQVLAVRME
jgi:hypothetical protein